jgi:hypothetical protein
VASIASSTSFAAWTMIPSVTPRISVVGAGAGTRPSAARRSSGKSVSTAPPVSNAAKSSTAIASFQPSRS